MVMCEVCGKGPAKYTVIIEGAKFEACERCAGHGKILEKPGAKKNVGGLGSYGNEKVRKTSSLKTGKTDRNRSYNTKEEIVENYAEVIKKEYNKTGKTYKEFANDLNETESYMRKIIRGDIIPTIATAKKLEKKLNIKLIEENEKDKEKINLRDSTPDEITLGDMVEIKKKK
jgi:putative transcription factor